MIQNNTSMDQNTITNGSIIISSLTILSYLLAINEYYENKAYWDYFHISDRIRTNMRCLCWTAVEKV